MTDPRSDLPLTPCTRGCRSGGQHFDDCPGEGCNGCAPRPAITGTRLCTRCTALLRGMLVGPNGAAVAEHRLTEELGQHLSAVAYDHDGGTGSKISEITPVSVARLDARTELGDVLLAWLEALCARRGLTGPDRFEIPSAAKYLATWLDEVVRWEDVADMWDQLAWAMGQAHALAPWRAELRHCHGVPCPECGKRELVVYSGDECVTCRACESLIHRDVYEEHVGRVAREAREGADGHTLAEISQALDVPLPTVRTWAHRDGKLEPIGRRGGTKTYSLTAASRLADDHRLRRRPA